MERRAPLLLHVGYHKTGTTWLQTGLFRDAGSGFALPWASHVIRQELVRPTPFQFDPEAARRAFLPALEEAHAAGRVPVLSDERLSGSPHSGGHDSAEVARRLAAVFPQARVLIGIREQGRAIASMYRQYVRDGGGAGLRGWLYPRNPYEVPQFRFSHWEYHHLVGLYRDLFGADRVRVLPVEDLAAGEAAYCARIAAFAGLEPPGQVPPGERYHSFSALTLTLKRPFNRWFVRNSLSPAARYYVRDHEARFARLDRWLPRLLSRPLDRRLARTVAAAVGDRYAASNRATATLTGLDLESLGYPVAPAAPAAGTRGEAPPAGKGTGG